MAKGNRNVGENMNRQFTEEKIKIKVEPKGLVKRKFKFNDFILSNLMIYLSDWQKLTPPVTSCA